ncbi:thiamine transport system permease protein [Rhodopseudomonas julia]|uniref:Thiamine transport system permease protein ThiP n=1 Tax=Rhodopseudomonas julia TaxID=200617 RepID=A0ABU0CAR3_9BRAD|nr:thiamine/thiamine pyrophosphate ABC transporter permease [Rhodopseudomonas julia]MDQ0327559.1 thiamine transport system permease protein [Rhodopseudomonas julia]
MTGSTDRRWRVAAGLAAIAALAVFLGGACLALLAQADATPDLSALASDRYLRGVVLFTLEQATLSTLLAVTGALPLAVALHRAQFPGRGLVLRLFLLPQALPVLVGALAIIAVWGRNGVVSDLGAALGFERLNVYGLSGILIAHTFFNMPLAARLMVAALDGVPTESWKLAGQLSLTPLTTFRVLEWPAIRTALPGASSLIFMLCVTSFTLVLTLGGGPGATTLEVAIYQALRYDFNPGLAVFLALTQIGLTALALAATLRLGQTTPGGFTLGRRARRYDPPLGFVRALDFAALTVGIAFVLSPFIATIVAGLRSDLVALLADPNVQRAAMTSGVVAIAAATLAILLAAPLLLARQALERSPSSRRPRERGRIAWRGLFELSGSLVLVVPPIVIGAGWFLLLRRVTDVFAAAPFVVVATNAVMAMPFIVRILAPALAVSAQRHDRLAESLGLFGLARLRHVEWPALKAPLALSFAFALALSLGDLGAMALFGSQDFITLPYLLLQRMGSYRTADAAGLALLLGVLCLGLMALAERGFRREEGL